MDDTILLRGIVGSTAYGLAHEGSDVDRIGLYVAPVERLFGLQKPMESIVTTDPDQTMHEVGKWCRLALNCNPTAMELVWLERYEVITPWGFDLIRIRKAFLSAKAVRNSYLGYATQQLRKIQSHAGDADARIRSEKHARHLVRLLHQGVGLHRDGELEIRLTNPGLIRERGKEIAIDPRAGELYLEDAVKAFDLERGVLPDSPDRDRVEAWLIDMRRAHYSIVKKEDE